MFSATATNPCTSSSPTFALDPSLASPVRHAIAQSIPIPVDSQSIPVPASMDPSTNPAVPTPTPAATVFRRASTHTSASDRYNPSVASINRFSRDCSFIEDALRQGDTIGHGLLLQDEPVTQLQFPQSNHISYPTPHQPADQFQVVRKLGAGSYAVVYLVRERLEDGAGLGREYALKCLSKIGLDAEALDAQMVEATIQQALPPHPNIATLYRTYASPSYLLLLLEYVPGEDLFYFLEQARDHEDLDPDSVSSGHGPSTPPTPSILASLHPKQLLSYRRLHLIASMFSQMCEAVAACHRTGVFHRDIKPENFIVTDGKTLSASGDYERMVVVKLTDFGLATRDVESSDVDCGSAPYMSYECRNNIAPTYTTAPADVWSLGIVLLNMLYHHNPWADTAKGACPSFSFYLQEPIQFFMQRFPGMTPAVAQFFAQKVFCILDPGKPQRITAHEFGIWARNLPRFLGPDSRRNPNIAFQMASVAPPDSTTPTPASRHHQQGSSSLFMDETDTPRPVSISSYRDKAPPPLSTLPPVEQPVFTSSSHQLDSDAESDFDDADAVSNGNKSRSGSTNKRRKRAARGKGTTGTATTTTTTPTTANATPLLLTPADHGEHLNQLANAMQNRAREISAAHGHSRQASLAQPPPLTVNTNTSATSGPSIKKKKSSNWGSIFRRDSGSDHEYVPEDFIPSSNNKGKEVVPAAAPTALVQNVSALVMGLNAPVQPPPPPSSTIVQQDSGRAWSGRGRKKSVAANSSPSVPAPDTRRRAPSAPAASDRNLRYVKSVDRLGGSSGGDVPPPVPALPASYRRPQQHQPQMSTSSSQFVASDMFSSVVAPPPPAPSSVFNPTGSTFSTTSSISSFNPTSSSSSYSPSPYGSGSKHSAPSVRSMMSTSTTSTNWRSSSSSRYAGSVWSVSTAATSVSSGSSSNWRNGAGQQTNVKYMEGIPPELDRVPRGPGQRHPKVPNNNNGYKGPTPPKRTGNADPVLPFLDTISERPRKHHAAPPPPPLSPTVLPQQQQPVTPTLPESPGFVSAMGGGENVEPAVSKASAGATKSRRWPWKR